MSGDDDDDSLICPITQEYFRDPVLAEDGHLYERAAITRWITEHGTSPFTRQVLDVNRLQPNDEVRSRADQQRQKLSVSYNRESDQVQLPPIRTRHDIHFNTIITDTRHQGRGHTYCQRCSKDQMRIIIYISMFFCIVLLFIILIVVSVISPPESSPTTMQDTTQSPLCSPLNYST